jgi:hypothetical protein
MPLKHGHSSPAPIRHKKKVRNYEKHSKKQETTIYLPSNQHKTGCENRSDSFRFLRLENRFYLGAVGFIPRLGCYQTTAFLSCLSCRSYNHSGFADFINLLKVKAMAKYYSLFGKTTTDTEVQVVKENQIVIGYGYAMSESRYVVYKVEHINNRGYMYHLINTDTKAMDSTDIINPLSKKFGIGRYYDDVKPEFMDAFELAILLQEAQAKAKAEEDEAEKERIRISEVKEVGRKRFSEIFPEDAQAVIVGRLKQDESDMQTDYFASSTQRTVILGFSIHKRDIFSEMRKHASNFEETAYLSEYNKDYEHREKYSMGAGYYLGESKYHGWIIEKVPVCDRTRTIEEFSYIAGNEDNIRINKPSGTLPVNPKLEDKANCTMVEYSAKAVAVFGNTKPIKDELKAMGGRFNSRLTFNGEKIAGWIFPKSKEQRLACYFGLD